MSGSEDRWWCTTREAAELLQVSRKIVLAMIEAGQLPAVRTTPRGHFRIRRVAVEEKLREWTTEAS